VPEAGLPTGAPAPTFRLPLVGGGEAGLDGLLAAGRPALLVFSDPACGPCRGLLPDLSRWQDEHAGRWTTVVVSRGDVETNRERALRYGLLRVLVQQDREVAMAYGCAGTPGAVLVGPDGRVAGPLLRGAEAIRAWVDESAAGAAPLAAATADRTAALPARPATVPVGAPAPEVRLPMLDGPLFDLADLRGAEAVLVLWNPGCGYCRRMLPDLLALEAELAADPAAPRLVVVSTGSLEANREQGLRSPVLLDGGFTLGRALGAQGTPSAVRIDAQGRIASEIAMGAETVLALARPEPVLAR
jgi:thiol-disulfide isomerase/thioredoxin